MSARRMERALVGDMDRAEADLALVGSASAERVAVVPAQVPVAVLAWVVEAVRVGAAAPENMEAGAESGLDSAARKGAGFWAEAIRPMRKSLPF
jgi:hypothetical protein